MDIHWTSYVGMVSGIFGVIVAFISLYKTSKIKTLDLRLELKRSVIDINDLYVELEEILPKSKRSRESINAAKGMSRSGGMKGWADDYAKDELIFRAIGEELPSKENTYSSMSSEILEKKLVEVHEQSNRLKALKNQYLESMSEDKKDSDFLRDQAHQRV